ncbi:hypothetical protein ACFL0W_05895 [Nanoarchaeota archaeon]
MVEIKRKLYKRGSSFETTIPKPILFALDLTEKHNVIFKYDKDQNRWYVDFELNKDEPNKEKKTKKEEK